MQKHLWLASALAGMLAASPAFAQTGHEGHVMPPAPDQAAAQMPCPMGSGMMGGGMGMGMGGGMMGGGMGRGMMMGPAMLNDLSAEDQQKFLDATKELRKKLHDKHFEYGEAARAPKANKDDLLKKRKELWDLQQKIHEKMWDFMK
ncbi:MAG: periplasmic heavy metal sensor [Thermodesulfobacteriota bacterium]